MRQKIFLGLMVVLFTALLAGCSSNNKVVSDEAKALLGVTGFAASSCSDSDGGKNYDVRGTTTGSDSRGKQRTFTDYCFTSGRFAGKLNEYYCTGSFIKSVQYSCSVNNVCMNGACVSLCGNGVVDPGEVCDDGNTNNGDTCIATCKCSDSDGGQNLPVLGEMRWSGSDGVTIMSSLDTCHYNLESVDEQYCTSTGQARHQVMNCGEGYHCNEGVCVVGELDDDGY